MSLENLRILLDETLTKVRFGGSCCDECKQKGTSCGGDKTATKFGATIAAPPPPDVGWPFTPGDVEKYAKYVDDRVTAMDQAWAKWHEPAYWDLGSPTQECLDWHAKLDVEDVSTPEDLKAAGRACHPQFFLQQGLAEAWSSSFVQGDEVGWNTWPIWSESFHMYADKLMAGGVGQWIKVMLEGSFFGDYPSLKKKHDDLIRFAALANNVSLVDVPDPGTPAVPKTTVDEVVSNPVTSDLGTLFVYGALGVGAILLFTRRR